MLNKLRIAAVIVAAVVGMVLYKRRFDAKEASEKAADRNPDGRRWE